ncbi:hypothetical protein MARPO_1024s0001 [Marchantia polymorpha]|uniref:Transmembrane protein n=1 Tax=Marchantia polymorpha TaxID=3197 RepID=A0A2R6VY68_MARPO|nr:hypothetical protein MARPO_1024s0001 [Marchantia polymorpha]|eukprot:PTQ26546.1 hypothetical protein MARPO_1024s0001 [Marchantia polymorpha]
MHTFLTSAHSFVRAFLIAGLLSRSLYLFPIFVFPNFWAFHKAPEISGIRSPAVVSENRRLAIHVAPFTFQTLVRRSTQISAAVAVCLFHFVASGVEADVGGVACYPLGPFHLSDSGEKEHTDFCCRGSLLVSLCSQWSRGRRRRSCLLSTWPLSDSGGKEHTDFCCRARRDCSIFELRGLAQEFRGRTTPWQASESRQPGGNDVSGGALAGRRKSEAWFSITIRSFDARARERAALLSREKAEGCSPGSRERVSNKDSDPALSREESKEEASEVVVEEESNAVSEIVPHTRRKKRKQHQEQKAELATLIDQEAPDSAVKVKKHKKLKVSDTTEEHVFPLEAPVSPETEEQEKKVNDTLTSEDNIERAEENSAADIDRSVPELVDFQVSIFGEETKERKEIEDTKRGQSGTRWWPFETDQWRGA